MSGQLTFTFTSTPRPRPTKNLIQKHTDDLENVSKLTSKGSKSRSQYKKARMVTPMGRKESARVLKNDKERMRYNSFSPTRKGVISKKVAANSKENMAKLSDDKVKRRVDKRNAQRRSTTRLNAIAKAHNAMFPYDKIPETQKERTRVNIMGKFTRHVTHCPPRVTNMGQDIYFNHDGLGPVDGGHFGETLDSSVLSVMRGVNDVLFQDPRNRKLVTIDLGSGKCQPGQVVCQYPFDQGFHVGIELSSGLDDGAVSNCRGVTLKGLNNIAKGYFNESYVMENGELNHVVPPRIWPVCGDIEKINHLAGFDAVYQFDRAIAPTTKLMVADLWEREESKNCKVIVSNSNPREMEAFGFVNIVLKRKVTVRTSGNEQRTAHIYARPHLRRGTLKYSFELEDVEVCPLFQEGFKLLRSGDKVAEELFTGFKVNQLLIDANLSKDALANLPKPSDRITRRPTRGTYNKKAMITNEWEKASAEELIAKVPSVIYENDDDSQPSTITLDSSIEN